jgi:ribose-phosphate pyrophosphokinase
MIANLLDVAGVTHIITIDLHASQMQGFFHCPIDNLFAEPLLADYIRREVPEYKRAVVVSKNPGGTKRVTSLADNLKLNFGIIMTDRYRMGGQGDTQSMMGSMMSSQILERPIHHGLDGIMESKHDRQQVEGENADILTGLSRLRIPHINGHRPSPLNHSASLEEEDDEEDVKPLSRAANGHSRIPSSSDVDEDEADAEFDDDDDDDIGSDSGDEGDVDPVRPYDL